MPEVAKVILSPTADVQRVQSVEEEEQGRSCVVQWEERRERLTRSPYEIEVPVAASVPSQARPPHRRPVEVKVCKKRPSRARNEQVWRGEVVREEEACSHARAEARERVVDGSERQER